jgi:replicative DNA helicase
MVIREIPNMRDEERVPPYNGEAERAVLGSVLLNNDCWGEVFANVNEEDFYVSANRIIFYGIYSLFEEGIPVDHVTLGNKLREQGKLDKIGGAIALSSLTDAVAAPSNVGHYANIVREASSIRRLIYCAQDVTVNGFKAEGIDSLSPSIEELIRAAQDLGKRRMPHNLLDIGGKVLENYRKAADGYRGIPFPWKTIDDMTAGAWPKTVTMFVARPSVGKTFVCIICGRHAWMKDKRVLIVSPEMSKDEIAERFFTIHSDVSYYNVITGQLPTVMEQKFVNTINGEVGKDGLWIMDSDDDLSPRGIDAAIRACNAELVAVDSIYDLHIKGDRRERAVEALGWMKRSCKELGYSSIGFAQQNRTAELSEKKGGGARLGTIALADEIGQDVHAVYALIQNKDDKDDKVMKFKNLKLRRGQYKKPEIKVHWDFDRMEFGEIEEEDEGNNYNDDIGF